MPKNLVTIGCSWMVGDELIDSSLEKKGIRSSHPSNDAYRLSHAFPGLIANHFGWTHENLSWSGASLQSMLWNLNWWLDNSSDNHISNSVLLLGLTFEGRMSWYNPNFEQSRKENQHECERYMHSNWLSQGFNIQGETKLEEWWDLNEIHYTLVDSYEWQMLNYITAVRSFDGIASRYGIPTYQFKVLCSHFPLKVPTLLDTPTAIEIIMKEHKIQGDLLKPNKHPNEKGHKLLANFLIEKLA